MWKIIQWIISIFKGYFPDASNHGVPQIPVTGNGDEIFTPTINNPSGDWSSYLSRPYEQQIYPFGDALDCVSQSGVHMIEAILNYHYQHSFAGFPLADQFVKLLQVGGYVNSQGYIELSVPYIATLAGTTRQGLAMDAFWNAVNTYGLVPKKVWNKDGAKTWDEYYEFPSQAVQLAGQEFAKIFQWNWKVLTNNNWGAPDFTMIREALSHCPLHFAGPLCNTVNGVMYYCGSQAYQHARVLYAVDNTQEIEDQYPPFLVKSELAFPIPCIIATALKIE